METFEFDPSQHYLFVTLDEAGEIDVMHSFGDVQGLLTAIYELTDTIEADIFEEGLNE